MIQNLLFFLNMSKNIEIYGLRSIIEAVDSSEEISKVLLIKSSASSSLFRSLVEKLEKKNIKYTYVPKEKFNKYKNKNHQGAVAILSPVPLISIEELVKSTYNESRELTYLLLDGVTDTRNFGAIIRTSVAAGVTGIIISQNARP